MFKYGISCALEELPVRQPVIIRGEIEHVAAEVKRAGYDLIELFIRNPQQYDPERLIRAAKNEGLDGFCAISTGMEFTKNGFCLIDDSVEKRAAAVARMKEHIDLGAAIGSPVVVGIIRGNIPDWNESDRYIGYYTDALHELCGYAAEKNTLIYVESIMRYINNYLNNVPETADFLRSVGEKNLFLHIDTHSMAVEDREEYKSVCYTKGILGYVHFSDNNRGYPGSGNVNFHDVMKALIDMDYQGIISTECTPYPTEFGCAERGLRYMKALEEIVRIENAPMFE